LEQIRYKYVVIEGNIGAGKTSVVDLLAKTLDARVLLETFENNPFLPEFYKDRNKNAFPLEMFFLAERYRQMNALRPEQQDIFNQLIISDYFISKSAIFSGFNLQRNEWDLFIRFFEIVEKSLPLPELLIYLHRDTDYLLRHIRQRGRGYEQHIEAAYLESVSQGYQKFFKAEKRFPVVVLDCGETDFFETGQIKQLTDRVLSRHWENGVQFIDFKG
jgi:deoxyadenosine/deoxycytidine kinase